MPLTTDTATDFCERRLPAIEHEHFLAIGAGTVQPIVMVFDLRDLPTRALAVKLLGSDAIRQLVSHSENAADAWDAYLATVALSFEQVQRWLFANDFVGEAAILSPPSGPAEIAALVFTAGGCDQVDCSGMTWIQ